MSIEVHHEQMKLLYEVLENSKNAASSVNTNKFWSFEYLILLHYRHVFIHGRENL